MNILLLTSDFLPNVGGMATHAHELAKAHVGNGHLVHLVVPVYGKGENSVEQLDGITVHRRFIDISIPKIKHLIYIRSIRNYILGLQQQYAFDVLHWHDLTPNCWTTYALRGKIPGVC